MPFNRTNYLITALLLCALPVFGANRFVTNTNDSGTGSLRQAILEANGSSGDIITINATGTITLLSDLPGIEKDMTINGPGAANVAIDGNHSFHPFFIGLGKTVTISGLTIKNGFTDTYVGGGGITNGATLTLLNVLLSGNSVNPVYGTGGAILSTGSLSMTNSTVVGNSADAGGGGILVLGQANLTNCTVSGNSTSAYGGGLFVALNAGPVTLTNTTISGNSAGIQGGNLSIAGNATVIMKNTLLANSLAGGNCFSFPAITSQGFNLSDDNSCTGLTQATDQNNAAAGLASTTPQNNGGPTPTMALLPTSNAVDKIPPANCAVSTDQRGVSRPQNGKCDIGAFELAGFASLTAKLGAVPGPHGSFDLNATLTLGSPLDSIDPITQPVTFSIGPYTVTIPPGSFHQLKNGAKKGAWVFAGTIGGVNLAIQIDPLGGAKYQFKAEGSPVNLTGLTSPATVSIAIGIKSGTAQAKF